MSTHHATNALELTLLLMLGCLIGLAPATGLASGQGNLDSFVASLEGGWAGEDNTTPFGSMPFAVLFERQEDGSLHSRSSLNSETYIDLRFSKDETGRWILREEAAMEGMAGQSHSLVPAGSADGMHRWVHAENPDYLAIDVGLRDKTMLMAVTLRGEEHVRFELDRLPPDGVAELRKELLAAAATKPANGTSIFDVVESPPAGVNPEAASGGGDDPIVLARQAIVTSPDDAEAYLALARVLGEAINENPMNGPVYAHEMLSSLRKSIELDPTLIEAYHWLVGYYLNAPPIAGGSVALAEETARRLAEFDAEGGARLLEEIASRRAAVQ